MAKPGWLAAVTFDLTGTLIHTPRLGAIYSEVLTRHGFEVSPARAERLVRQVWAELDCSAHPSRDRFAVHPGGARGWWGRFVERLCEHLRSAAAGGPAPMRAGRAGSRHALAGDAGPARFAAAELFARFAEPAAWELYPDTEPALAELARRGLRLGLISNWDERLPRLVERLGLGSRFEVVVHSQQVGAEKPDRRIFAAALTRLGLPAGRVLHVGDRRRQDVEGAVAAGMRGLLIDREGGAGDLARLTELAPRLDEGRW